jgi:hypothetical protein
VTELFPQNSDYIDNDTVFGVREGLIVPFVKSSNQEVAQRFGLDTPFYEVKFDFKLVKQA